MLLSRRWGRGAAVAIATVCAYLATACGPASRAERTLRDKGFTEVRVEASGCGDEAAFTARDAEGRLCTGTVGFGRGVGIEMSCTTDG